jgi:hypothetical protein
LGEDGVLSGIPEQAGEFAISVTVQVGVQSETKAFQVSVAIPVVDVNAVIDALLELPSSMTEEAAYYLDFLGNRNGSLDVGDFYLYQNPAIPSTVRVRDVAPKPDSIPAAGPDSRERRP